MTVAKWVIITLLNVTMIALLARHSSQTKEVIKDRQLSTADQRNANLVLLGCIVLYFFTQFPLVLFNCLRIGEGCAVVLASGKALFSYGQCFCSQSKAVLSIQSDPGGLLFLESARVFCLLSELFCEFPALLFCV